MATSQPLAPHKASFYEACTAGAVLTFGTFILKSKRESPYFFNAGLLHRADLLRATADAYARTIAAHNPPLDFDVVFGPAYKGIPLAATTVAQLGVLDPERFGHVSYSFNRKEAKDHGEGGIVVGAPLQGKKVLIIDDVMTAGTAMKQAMEIVKTQGGTVQGIVIAFDRMETMPPPNGTSEPASRLSAVASFHQEYKIPVLSILTLDDVTEALREKGSAADIQRLDEYRQRYRAEY